jgi:polar amino acid transport system substrate-binding protein
VGDIVACAGGGYANHADEAVVPKNLVVKLPDGVDPRAAAYTTIASISLQGVRLAKPTLGEVAVVVGLGIVGQLAAQILKSNGCRVFGTDLEKKQVQLALESGAIDKGGVTGRDSIESLVSDFSRGRGADMTIICAGTSSNQPVELAAEVTRKKGRVIVVGAVNMNLPRESFFKKELSFAVSCSYGPGRYDPSYEEEGKDYPYPYVRWTEGRNMEAILDSMASGVIDPRKVTTHTFSIDDAPKAYEIIAAKSEHFCGMLIEYPEKKREEVQKVELKAATNPVKADKIGIGMVGPGSFAQTFLLPPLKKDNRIYFSSVCTRSGLTASDTGDRLGFRRAVSSIDEMLKDKETHAAVVATRHDTHAESVLKSIAANKAVFVEKPLCLTKGELAEIAAKQKQNNTLIQVGFNRRFSKAAIAAKKFIGESHPPLTMNYRISAGHISRDHWTQTKEGGGRILGEVCHFIDLLQYFADANPVKVHAFSINTEDESIVTDDNTVISIKFADGSVGSISYFAEGGKSMPKERCEILGGNRSAVIDNFTKVEFYDKSKKRTGKFSGKGHAEEIVAFVSALKTGEPAIAMDSQIATTLASFAVLQSIETGKEILIDTEKI